MNKTKISLMVICVCMVLASCKTDSVVQPGEEGIQQIDWCSIAGIDGNDKITGRHLYSLMKSHGIVCAMEGSIGYSVIVPKAKRSEAIEIIKEDLKKRKYYINIDNQFAYTVPESDWRETELNVTFDKCLQLYPESTDLGAALRAPVFVKEKGIFLYVLKVKSLEREYMGLDKKFHIGHEFEIETALNTDGKLMIKTYRCQVFEWDSKKEFICSGASGAILSSEVLKEFMSVMTAGAAGAKSSTQPVSISQKR